MEMKNKLHYKRPNWFLYIKNISYLFDEFCGSKYFRNRNIKSMSRKAYYFLLNKYGRSWIKHMRDFYSREYRFYTDEELVRIIKTPWIKLSEDE